MTEANTSTNTNADLGTARKPVYDPITFMWIGLLGIPGFLIFMILYKLSQIAQ